MFPPLYLKVSFNNSYCEGMEEFPYIDKSFENVRDVDPRDISDFQEELGSAEGVILSGEGRSYSALKIWGSELAKSMTEFDVYTPEDPGFPGDRPKDFMPVFDDRYDKFLWIFNSGSGESEDPVNYSKEAAKYIEENGVDSCSLLAITSDPESRIAKNVEDHGTVLELKGREKGKEEIDYLEEGTMGDIFENGSLLLGQILVESLYFEDKEPMEILPEKERKIYKDLENMNNEALEKMITKISEKHDVRFDGKGSAREVANMASIRTDHVKALPQSGGKSQVRGGPERRHSPGDLLIAFSSSGKTPYTIQSCKNWKENDGEVISITGTPGSSITEISDQSIEIESTGNDREPEDFYSRAAYIYGHVPNLYLKRLEEKGHRIPEEILEDIHR